MKKAIRLVISISFFITQVVWAHANEANFWKERREVLQLASALPFPTPNLNFPPIQKLAPNTFTNDPQRKKHSEKLPVLDQVLESILYNSGSIRGIHHPPKGQSKKLIVLVHDVHMNTEAHRNISSVLQNLIQKTPLDFIAVEGSFSEINLSQFHTYPQQDTIARIADFLLDQHKISGSVHAALTTPDTSLDIFGVDDPQLYSANVDAYQKGAPYSKDYLLRLQTKIKLLVAEGRNALSPKLYSFDSIVQQYNEKKISLKSYLELLSRYQPLPSPLERFLAAIQMEESIDIKMVEKERSEFLDKLYPFLNENEVSVLVQKGMSYRLAKIGAKDFYNHLWELSRQKGIKLKKYWHLNNFMDYVLLSSSFEGAAIFNAIQNFEQKIYTRFAITPKEKQLVGQIQQNRSLQKLVTFSLTPNDWKRITHLNAVDSISDLEYLPAFSRFYEMAQARDQAMAKNIIDKYSDHELVSGALVSGGFHADGLVKHLTKAGYSVISFVPKLTKVESVKGESYLSVFTQEKTPLEKLVSGEKLFLARNHAFGLPLIAPLGVAIESHRQWLPKKKPRPSHIYQSLSVNPKKPLIEVKPENSTIHVTVHSPRGSVKTSVDLAPSLENPTRAANINSMQSSKPFWDSKSAVLLARSKISELNLEFNHPKLLTLTWIAALITVGIAFSYFYVDPSILPTDYKTDYAANGFFSIFTLRKNKSKKNRRKNNTNISLGMEVLEPRNLLSATTLDPTQGVLPLEDPLIESQNSVESESALFESETLSTLVGSKNFTLNQNDSRSINYASIQLGNHEFELSKGIKFDFGPEFTDFTGITEKITGDPDSPRFYVTERQTRTIFEIDSEGNELQRIDISALRLPPLDEFAIPVPGVFIEPDPESIVHLFGNIVAVALRESNHIAVFEIPNVVDENSNPVIINKSDVTFLQTGGGVTGLAYDRTENIFYLSSHAREGNPGTPELPNKLFRVKYDLKTGDRIFIEDMDLGSLPVADLGHLTDIEMDLRLRNGSLFLVFEHGILEIDPITLTVLNKLPTPVDFPKLNDFSVGTDGALRLVGESVAGLTETNMITMRTARALPTIIPNIKAGSQLPVLGDVTQDNGIPGGQLFIRTTAVDLPFVRPSKSAVNSRTGHTFVLDRTKPLIHEIAPDLTTIRSIDISALIPKPFNDPITGEQIIPSVRGFSFGNDGQFSIVIDGADLNYITTLTDDVLALDQTNTRRFLNFKNLSGVAVDGLTDDRYFVDSLSKALIITDQASTLLRVIDLSDLKNELPGIDGTIITVEADPEGIVLLTGGSTPRLALVMKGHPLSISQEPLELVVFDLPIDATEINRTDVLAFPLPGNPNSLSYNSATNELAFVTEGQFAGENLPRTQKYLVTMTLDQRTNELRFKNGVNLDGVLPDDIVRVTGVSYTSHSNTFFVLGINASDEVRLLEIRLTSHGAEVLQKFPANQYRGIVEANDLTVQLDGSFLLVTTKKEEFDTPVNEFVLAPIFLGQNSGLQSQFDVVDVDGDGEHPVPVSADGILKDFMVSWSWRVNGVSFKSGSTLEIETITPKLLVGQNTIQLFITDGFGQTTEVRRVQINVLPQSSDRPPVPTVTAQGPFIADGSDRAEIILDLNSRLDPDGDPIVMYQIFHEGKLVFDGTPEQQARFFVNGLGEKTFTIKLYSQNENTIFLSQSIDITTTVEKFSGTLADVRFTRDFGRDLELSNVFHALAGIAFNPDTETLFVTDSRAGDELGKNTIMEIFPDGSLKRLIEIPSVVDPEGIVYMGENRFAIVTEASETSSSLVIVEIPPGNENISINIDPNQVYSLFGNPRGITYDSANNVFYFVSEKTTMNPTEVGKFWINPNTNELQILNRVTIESLGIFLPTGILFAPGLDAEGRDRVTLFILTEDGLIREINFLDPEDTSKLSSEPEIIGTLQLPKEITRASGLTIDPDTGTIYVVNKGDGDGFTVFIPDRKLSIGNPGPIQPIPNDADGGFFIFLIDLFTAGPQNRPGRAGGGDGLGGIGVTGGGGGGISAGIGGSALNTFPHVVLIPGFIPDEKAEEQKMKGAPIEWPPGTPVPAKSGGAIEVIPEIPEKEPIPFATVIDAGDFKTSRSGLEPTSTKIPEQIKTERSLDEPSESSSENWDIRFPLFALLALLLNLLVLSIKPIQRWIRKFNNKSTDQPKDGSPRPFHSFWRWVWSAQVVITLFVAALLLTVTGNDTIQTQKTSTLSREHVAAAEDSTNTPEPVVEKQEQEITKDSPRSPPQDEVVAKARADLATLQAELAALKEDLKHQRAVADTIERINNQIDKLKRLDPHPLRKKATNLKKYPFELSNQNENEQRENISTNKPEVQKLIKGWELHEKTGLIALVKDLETDLKLGKWPFYLTENPETKHWKQITTAGYLLWEQEKYKDILFPYQIKLLKGLTPEAKIIRLKGKLYQVFPTRPLVDLTEKAEEMMGRSLELENQMDQLRDSINASKENLPNLKEKTRPEFRTKSPKRLEREIAEQQRKVDTAEETLVEIEGLNANLNLIDPVKNQLRALIRGIRQGKLDHLDTILGPEKILGLSTFDRGFALDRKSENDTIEQALQELAEEMLGEDSPSSFEFQTALKILFETVDSSARFADGIETPSHMVIPVTTKDQSTVLKILKQSRNSKLILIMDQKSQKEFESFAETKRVKIISLSDNNPLFVTAQQRRVVNINTFLSAYSILTEFEQANSIIRFPSDLTFSRPSSNFQLRLFPAVFEFVDRNLSTVRMTRDRLGLMLEAAKLTKISA